MRVRPSYTPEFRADAVALLRRTDRPLHQVASDLGVSNVTLRDWYNRDEMSKKGKFKGAVKAVPVALLHDESAKDRMARLERENAALRKEVDSLRMDREILKKAAANSIVRCNGGTIERRIEWAKDDDVGSLLGREASFGRGGSRASHSAKLGVPSTRRRLPFTGFFRRAVASLRWRGVATSVY